jgi:archaetidylinositol phosphate synthase
MASSLIEFCEQANPEILSEARKMKPFQNAPRIQQSLVAQVEKRVLVWMAERTPDWIGPDHLTILGLAAQVMAGTSYALARWNQFWLLVVIGFLALNWLGDSLDGTLARVRQRQRPRYGFYVDHMMDSFGALALMGGLAMSGYMPPQIAMALLTAFLLLSIQSYLATYTLGEFRLSFWCFGPTEMRMLLAIGNVVLLYHPMVLGGRYRLFDVGGTIAIAGMVLILLFATGSTTCRLYRDERLR